MEARKLSNWGGKKGGKENKTRENEMNGLSEPTMERNSAESRKKRKEKRRGLGEGEANFDGNWFLLRLFFFREEYTDIFRGKEKVSARR
jgi:hypothetical protein